MVQSNWTSRKVVIVGAGDVGATFAYALAQDGAADEICLIDLNDNLCKGQVLDLSHGLPFYPTIDICVGDEKDYKDAQVIVITAGAAQNKGETRLDLLKKNASIVGNISEQIAEQNSRAIVLVVTNPVDILTKVALESSGFPRERVIGSGTVLDTSRFRYQLSQKLDVHVGNVHGYILGEHGDSEFAAWSMSNIAGVPIEVYSELKKLENWDEQKKEIEQTVRDSAYHIIDYKGATNFAVGLALVQITGAILKNQNRVLTVSYHLEGEYNLDDVALSVPCMISQNGVEHVISAHLPPAEQKLLEKSATLLSKEYSDLND